MLTKLSKKYQRYYKQAYNNPKQFGTLNLSRFADSPMHQGILDGVVDAALDKLNDTYKFKLS